MDAHENSAVLQEQMEVEFPQRVLPLRWLPRRQVHVAFGDAPNGDYSLGFVKHRFDSQGDANGFIGLHQGQDILSVGFCFPLLVQYPGLTK